MLVTCVPREDTPSSQHDAAATVTTNLGEQPEVTDENGAEGRGRKPSLPLKPGRGGTMTYDYKRNGIIDLFAAMNIATGEVLTGFRSGTLAEDIVAKVQRGRDALHQIKSTTDH